MNSKEFLKYLKTLDFPNKKYSAITSYPGTEHINGKYINDFNSKYKKKYLYDHEDKNIVLNEDAKKLFNSSFSYISKIQENLLNKNISNYIYGGAALKLYSLLSNIKNNENIFKTKDYDIALYLDENKKKINNKIIYETSLKIIDSILLYANNPNFAFLELYILINFENTKKFSEIIDVYMNNDFELHYYKENHEKNTYTFKFLKVINKEFCIRLKVKFSKLDAFLKEKIYSYIKTTYYYINRLPNGVFKVVNKYIPIEMLIKNKKELNIELMTNEITLHNNHFYLYNQNTLLYNLMHLYYKYHFDTENSTIPLKKEAGKNIRDEKRLNLFFKIYCKMLYKKYDNSNVNNLLLKLKNKEKKFKKSIEKIKDFKVINTIF